VKKILTAVLTAGLLLGITACSETPNANNTFTSKDGTVTEFKAPARTKAVTWMSKDSDGKTISSKDYLGQVVVLNFWYAGCTPCRVETPMLVALAKEFSAQAKFIGVNVRDTVDTANAFKRTFKVTYPTILDSETGTVVLAYTGVVTPSAVPTTLVIDKKGRVAARILGVAEKDTLKAIIQTVVAEDASK
jgi:thiol-disulfide isomerase/thioredoxin